MSTEQNQGDNANPFAVWTRLLDNALGDAAGGGVYKEWEKWLGTQLDKLARNESFLGQMSKALETSAVFKAQADRMVEASLRAMRMPTQGDLEELHKRLDSLERAVAALQEVRGGGAHPADPIDAGANA